MDRECSIKHRHLLPPIHSTLGPVMVMNYDPWRVPAASYSDFRIHGATNADRNKWKSLEKVGGPSSLDG